VSVGIAFNFSQRPGHHKASSLRTLQKPEGDPFPNWHFLSSNGETVPQLTLTLALALFVRR
jgi:hypothetical protein